MTKTMHMYTAYASIDNYLLTAAFDQSGDQIECLGWTDDDFPAPESFEDADELLAFQGFRREAPWFEDAPGEFSAPVTRD